MNINYSKLYSSQLDNMKDINIRSSWELEEENAWVIIEDLIMIRGCKSTRIRKVSLTSWKYIFDQEGSSIQARIEIYN